MLDYKIEISTKELSSRANSNQLSRFDPKQAQGLCHGEYTEFPRSSHARAVCLQLNTACHVHVVE